jgi:hypothetical protein
MTVPVGVGWIVPTPAGHPEVRGRFGHMSDGEARRVWNQLLREPWVDPKADFDTVMARLAGNDSVMALIARDEQFIDGRDTTAGAFHSELVVIPAGGHRLVEELHDIARAPYVAMPWPDPPGIPTERLVADWESTTGRTVEFDWRWEPRPDGASWWCEIRIDGSVCGGIGDDWSADPEEALVEFADRACDEHLSETVEEWWPLCASHGRVLRPRIGYAGTACWACPVEPPHDVEIGQLPTRAP